jgi:hypothetical protein
MRRTKLYAASREGEPVKFTPLPATWFNKRRFEDDLPPAIIAAQKPATAADNEPPFDWRKIAQERGGMKADHAALRKTWAQLDPSTRAHLTKLSAAVAV